MEQSAPEPVRGRPERLSEAFGIGDKHPQLWRSEELAALFRHQLAAPIDVDLGSLAPGRASQLAAISHQQSLTLRSFGDLFRHPQPPLDLLNFTKDFAKANRDHPNSPLPNEIASVLYFLAIAAALVRRDTRISRLSDEKLRAGFDWSLQKDWVSEEAKQLLSAATGKTAGSSSQPSGDVAT